MVHLISYDLNGHERPAAYEHVKQVIEQHATAAYRVLYSQWLVETNQSSVAWWNALKEVVDRNDRVFICQVPNRACFGYLDAEAGEWLKQRRHLPDCELRPLAAFGAVKPRSSVTVHPGRGERERIP